LHKHSKQRAKGAQYESQGQARSEAERVAPGERKRSDPALKARNTRDISAFQTLCPALAPGFHISRLWRSVSTFCAKPIRGFFLPQSRRARKDYAETI
jgi:hypothetical protein